MPSVIGKSVFRDLRPAFTRAVATSAVLLGISLFTFAAVSALPGNAAEQLLGADATAEQVARLEAELGLAGSPWESYFRWMAGAVSGDLGKSIANNQPVAVLIAERLPVSLGLVGLSFTVALLLAVPAALAAAYRRNAMLDRASAALSIAALSVPNYVFALVLVLAFSVHLKLFPSIGYDVESSGLAGNLRYLTLPALAIGIPLFGLYTRFLRGDLVEQMSNEDYTVAAAAKGISTWQVLVRHALPNSLFGLITIVGVNVGTIMGGTVIVEQIFALPGLGQLLMQAVHTRDVAVVQGVVLLLAAITVIANLAADILYAVLDPRLREYVVGGAQR